MEGSALGVPRDEVGLAEQCELLLLLQELCEPARRWTTGFWAKSTPVRHRGKGRVRGMWGGCSKRWLMQPQRLCPYSTRLAGLEADQSVSDDVEIKAELKLSSRAGGEQSFLLALNTKSFPCTSWTYRIIDP